MAFQGALSLEPADASRPGRLFDLDPDRDDAVGVAVSAVLPLGALVILDGLKTAFGFVPVSGADGVDALGVLLTTILFPMWGVARWAAARKGERGRAAGWWVVGLMMFALLLDVVAPFADAFWTAVGSLVLVVIMTATTARLATVSRGAVLWMIPGFAVSSIGAVHAYVLATGGWSPGLAITVGGLAGSPHASGHLAVPSGDDEPGGAASEA